MAHERPVHTSNSILPLVTHPPEWHALAAMVIFSGFGRASFWYENSILTSGIPKIGSEPIRARQLQKNGLGGAGTQYDF